VTTDRTTYPVLVLGGASWNTMVYFDEFPKPVPTTIHSARSNIAAGSTGIGKAMALKALGHEALLHATLGADDAGQKICTHCVEHGLPAWFDIDPAGTSRHVNLMDAQGQRISIFLCNGSPQPPTEVDRWVEPIAQAGTIFLNITLSSIPLLPLVAASNADVWVDLHDYDGVNPYHEQFIAEADVLQFSDEAVPDPRALMQRLIQAARLVVCTRGSRGSLALDASGQWHDLPAAPATLVDSNGAGDTFFVGLWHALQAQQPLTLALHFASTAAAMAVESLELVPKSLDAASVEQRLALQAGQATGNGRST
jgi:acarbose 7IV-phosphotransferase